jgi:hypothetical protein
MPPGMYSTIHLLEIISLQVPSILSILLGISPWLLCLRTQPVGMASKSTTAAENVYAPLVMVSIGAR